MRDYSRLDAFLDRLRGDLYPDEAGDNQHVEITQRVIASLVDSGHVFPGMKILDVGAGTGTAADIFEKHDCLVTAIDLVNWQKMDQSFITFKEECFDFVWARHVLEHSPMPYFTLTEYHRVLKPGGFCYVEVPAPDTGAEHETNQNHYSVMGARMWANLMHRAGFEHINATKLDFNIKQSDGILIPDTYFCFLLRKAPDGSRTDPRQ